MKAGMLLAGRYLLISELGRGGFGVVWEARDQTLSRQVAVKTLAHKGLSNGNDIRRMLREVEILAQLSHPNIVMAFDQGEAEDGTDRFSYLVMELLDGPTLAGIIATEPPDLVRSLVWGQQLCAALAVAHATRVIHRDVKPENIMITGPHRELLKVLDFGIAQIGDNVDSLTTTGSVIGSARYLAPERWAGGPGTVRSDLYAVGCVLFELFTGKRPFSATNQFALMDQHRGQPRVRPAALPLPLGDLLVELLAVDPADRPVDAEEVRRRLLRISDGIRELRRRADAAWDTAEGDRVPDAVARLRELVPEFARAFGPTDGRTLRTCHDLAVSLARAGRTAEAYCLLAELLPAAVGALGAEHRDVADIEHRLSRMVRPAQPCDEGLLAGLLAG